MNEFIGNHIKTIVNWGQYIALGIGLIGLLTIYLLGRKNKYYLPKGIGNWLLALFSFLVIVFAILVFARITQIKPGVQVILNQLDGLLDKPAPSLSFQDITTNEQYQITDFRDKVVLLNFWATWCAPCLKELPDLNQLQEDYKDQGLIVLAISDEDQNRLAAYALKHPFDAQVGRVENFDWTDLNSERPATFLIDKEGVVRAYFTGPYEYEFFAEQITPFLAK